LLLTLRTSIASIAIRRELQQLTSHITHHTSHIATWARLHPRPLEAVLLASFLRGRQVRQSRKRKRHPGHLVKQPPKTQGANPTTQQKATDPKTQVS
jgi:hypothetical protein